MTFMCKRWTQQQLVGKIISNPQKCQERLLAFNKWVFFNACWLWHDTSTSTRWSNFNFKIGILAPNTSSNVSNWLKHVLWPHQVIAEPHGTHTHTHTHLSMAQTCLVTTSSDRKTSWAKLAQTCLETHTRTHIFQWLKRVLWPLLVIAKPHEPNRFKRMSNARAHQAQMFCNSKNAQSKHALDYGMCVNVLQKKYKKILSWYVDIYAKY